MPAPQYMDDWGVLGSYGGWNMSRTTHCGFEYVDYSWWSGISSVKSIAVDEGSGMEGFTVKTRFHAFVVFGFW